MGKVKVKIRKLRSMIRAGYSSVQQFCQLVEVTIDSTWPTGLIVAPSRDWQVANLKKVKMASKSLFA